jgi:multiple sugar transport system substrate-binding protein
MKSTIRRTLAGAAVAAALAGTAQAGTLAVNVAFKGAGQRVVWQQIFDQFKKAHPEIDLKVAFVDEEA